MQTQPTNPLIKQLRSSISHQDIIYLVRVNYALQVAIKRPDTERGKNITAEISRVFGYDLMPNGLLCSELQIIEDLVEACPQIISGRTLNIRLL